MYSTFSKMFEAKFAITNNEFDLMFITFLTMLLKLISNIDCSFQLLTRTSHMIKFINYAIRIKEIKLFSKTLQKPESKITNA